MSKARNLADFISNPTVEATEIANGAVTAEKLHTTLDLSSKTLTFANNHISGDNIHGGLISDFQSTGIDDNATSTAVTISTDGNATFANGVTATSFTGDGSNLTGLPPGYTNSDVAAYLSANDYDTATNIIAEISNSAPTTLNTLNELAAALGDDANFSTTVTDALGNRLRIDTAAQSLTGTQKTNALTNLGITSTVAELNYTDGVTSNIQTQLAAKLPLSGGTLTGDLTLDKLSAKVIFTDTGGGPHGLDFYDTDGTLKWGYYYRTNPDTISWEVGGSSAVLTLDTSGNLILSGNSADLNLRTGATGQTAFINWQFNTTTTNYIQMGIDYDTRASTGWFIDSGYPITIDYTTSLQFKASGTNTISMDSGGNLSNVGILTAARARLTGTGDLSLSSTNHAFQIGADNVANIAIDQNEIMARNNGATSNLYIQNDGGGTYLGGLLSVVAGITSSGGVIRGTDTTGAGTPTFSFTGDTNTGMYHVSADTLGFTTGGTERARISSGGLVLTTALTTGGTLNASNGLIIGRTSTTTSFWQANDAGTMSVRGSTTHPALISFHRAGAYAFQFGLDTDNHLKMGGWSIGNNIPHTWQNNGNYLATGNITAYSSDKRLKTNVVNIPDALNKVMSLNGVTFDWKDEVQDLGFKPTRMYNEAGVLAQEVEAVLPQATAPAPFDLENDNGQTVSKSGKNYLTVQYEKIVPLLIEAIKEQQAQIEELKKKIQE